MTILITLYAPFKDGSVTGADGLTYQVRNGLVMVPSVDVASLEVAGYVRAPASEGNPVESGGAFPTLQSGQLLFGADDGSVQQSAGFVVATPHDVHGYYDLSVFSPPLAVTSYQPTVALDAGDWGDGTAYADITLATGGDEHFNVTLHEGDPTVLDIAGGLKVIGLDATGSGTATFAASNAPAAISPQKWLKVRIGDVDGWLPWFAAGA